MITIQLNGRERALTAPITLQELLGELRLQSAGHAIAVNNEVIPRSEYETLRVSDRDRIEIVQAVGGG